MKEQALVSVVIPTYKRADMLKNAINSVQSQTYKNIEVIVIDDNDPNCEHRLKTKELMKYYENQVNIRYICHSKNLNGSAARNTGIKNSLGEYIAFLDDDDEFLPKKIELQVSRLEELGDQWGICYTKFSREKNGKLFDRGIEEREGHLNTEILKGTFFISAGSNMLLRRSVVEEIGGFNESFKRRQDLEFLLRASLITKIAHVSQDCLIINKDDRSNMLDLEKLKVNTTDFLDSFKEYINQLPQKEMRKVYTSQYLSIIRYHIISLDIKSIISACSKYNVSYSVLFRYVIYLIRRRIKKVCYGFKI